MAGPEKTFYPPPLRRVLSPNTTDFMTPMQCLYIYREKAFGVHGVLVPRVYCKIYFPDPLLVLGVAESQLTVGG